MNPSSLTTYLTDLNEICNTNNLKIRPPPQPRTSVLNVLNVVARWRHGLRCAPWSQFPCLSWFSRSSTASTWCTSGIRFPPASSSSQDQQPNRPNPIPTQRRLTLQLSKHLPQVKSLRRSSALCRHALRGAAPAPTSPET